MIDGILHTQLKEVANGGNQFDHLIVRHVVRGAVVRWEGVVCRRVGSTLVRRALAVGLVVGGVGHVVVEKRDRGLREESLSAK